MRPFVQEHGKRGTGTLKLLPILPPMHDSPHTAAAAAAAAAAAHLAAADWSRAAAPATMGVDMEVPSMGPYQPLTSVDTICSPGAVRCTVVLRMEGRAACRLAGA